MSLGTLKFNNNFPSFPQRNYNDDDVKIIKNTLKNTSLKLL